MSSRELLRLYEHIFEAHGRPTNRTWFVGKSDCITLDAPTQPIQKLLFVPLNKDGVTSNTQRRRDRMMSVQFTFKPVGPFRNPWYCVNVRDGCPNKSFVRTC